MRSIARRSLPLVAGLCLLSGCYRPMMTSPNGYGYGGAYSSGAYGGYPGIQTLTPGQYYAPGAIGTPTYAPNGLQPIPDSSNGGGTGGGATGGGNVGDAPLYNPDADSSAPVRPVPTYDGDAPGNGLQEPASDGQIRENDSGTGQPSVQLDTGAGSNWAAEPIERTGLQTETAIEPTEPEAAADEPPLFAPVP